MSQQGPELKRTLGLWHVFSISVGLVVASTTLAGDFNGWGTAGPGYFVALLIGFFINLLVVFSFAELSTMFPKAGQIYEFTKDAFNRGKEVLGTGVGTTYWAMMSVVFGAEIAAGAWALQAATGVGSIIGWILFITTVCLVINLLGIELAAWLEVVLVIMMVGIRVVIGLIGFSGMSLLGKYDWSVFSNFVPFGWESVWAVIPIAFWAFVGLEFAVPLVEEIIDPEKSLPLGMILGAFAILVMAIIMGFGVIGVSNPSTHTEMFIGDAPQIEVGKALLGRAGMLLMGIASFTATMGSVNVALSAIPRISYAMARDGLWPKIFAWVHPKFRTPWPAIILTYVIFTIVPIVSNNVVTLINTAAFLWLAVYFWTHMLTLKLKVDQPETNRPFKIPFAVPVIGALLILWGIYAAFNGAWNIGLVGFFITLFCFAYALIWNAFGISEREKYAAEKQGIAENE